MDCYFCKEEISVEEKVGRRDTCPHCHRDLRCSKQCKFYALSAYKECKDGAAERIVDKERANFCDFFLPRGSKVNGGGYNKTLEAKKALENLFKKK